MFSFNNKTYFFTTEEMITVENTESFITSLLESLLETFSTNQPSMFRLRCEDRQYNFIIGYNDILVMITSPKGIYVQSFGEDIFEFSENVVAQTEKAIRAFKDNPKVYKKLLALHEELCISSTSTIEVFGCYDIRKKTIDDLLYAYENHKPYALIYDQLDDLSETYRIVTDNITYLISISAVSIDVELIDINMNDFSKLLYNELKTSSNPFIKKSLKKLNKYIKESEKKEQ